MKCKNCSHEIIKIDEDEYRHECPCEDCYTHVKCMICGCMKPEPEEKICKVDDCRYNMPDLKGIGRCQIPDQIIIAKTNKDTAQCVSFKRCYE